MSFYLKANMFNPLFYLFIFVSANKPPVSQTQIYLSRVGVLEDYAASHPDANVRSMASCELAIRKSWPIVTVGC